MIIKRLSAHAGKAPRGTAARMWVRIGLGLRVTVGGYVKQGTVTEDGWAGTVRGGDVGGRGASRLWHRRHTLR